MTSGNRHDSKEAVPLLKRFNRKNMKSKPVLSRIEKKLLNQQGIIETVIGHIKLSFQVWHTRHRSIMNALTH